MKGMGLVMAWLHDRWLPVMVGARRERDCLVGPGCGTGERRVGLDEV